MIVGLIVAAVLSAAPASPGIPACEYEDGSSQKVCIWDGHHMGNGVGASVIVVDGGTDHARVVFISHRKAHRLLGL